jgi:hypothetical protein
MYGLALNNNGDLLLIQGSIQEVTDIVYIAQSLMIQVLSDVGEVPYDPSSGFNLASQVGQSSTDAKLLNIKLRINNKLAKYSNGMENVTCDITRSDKKINITFQYIDFFNNEVYNITGYSFSNKGEFLYTLTVDSTRQPLISQDVSPLKLKIVATENGKLQINGALPYHIKFMGLFESIPEKQTVDINVNLTDVDEVDIKTLINSLGLDYDNISIIDYDFGDVTYEIQYSGNDNIIFVINDSDNDSGQLSVDYYESSLAFNVNLIQSKDIPKDRVNAHRFIGGGFEIEASSIVKGKTYYVTSGETIFKEFTQ